MKSNIIRIITIGLIAIAATSCQKDKKDTVTIREVSSWKIEYLGQGTVTVDRKDFKCEKFRTSGTGALYHSLYVVAAGKVNTDAQILSAMQEDRDYYEDLVRQGKARRVTDLLSNADPDINTDYDALKAGIYDAFLFGYNSRGYYTGDFAKITFNVADSVDKASYADWLGVWNAGEGFDFEIIKDEDGINYKIDGWQGYKAPHSILADYDDATGNLRIFGHDYGDYPDGANTYRFLFTGDIAKDGELVAIQGTNDQLLATATLSDDGYSATLTGAQVTLTGETTPRTYCLIEYLGFNKNSDEILTFTPEAPSLPCTINFKAETKSLNAQSAPATVRTSTRRSANAVKTNASRNTAATKAASSPKSIRKNVTR